MVALMFLLPHTRTGMPPANPTAFQQRQREVSGVVDRWQSWRRPVSAGWARQAPPQVQLLLQRCFCACGSSMPTSSKCRLRSEKTPKFRAPNLQAARRHSDLSTDAAATSVAAPALAASRPDESLDLSSQLELQNIRESLIRQEDTIIFCIIERAQFAANAPVYQPNAVPVPQFDSDGRRYSLLEYILRKTEELHGSIRRFTSPDEHAFYPEAVPSLVLPPLKYPEVLAPYAKDININGEVMNMYQQHLLPGITRDDDDGNYGSTTCCDVLCLQALSKRIHYGKFVAEAKFRSQRDTYAPLIQRQDVEGIMDALTDRAVELKIVDRVRWKAATYGQEAALAPQHSNAEAAGSCSGQRYKVAPDTVAMLYDKWVMPMTKQVQVQYLLRRLECEDSDLS